MGFIVNEFIEKKQCLIRGLAHPVIFSGNTSGESSMRNLYVKFGAVPVSPTSYYEVIPPPPPNFMLYDQDHLTDLAGSGNTNGP